MTVHSTEDCLGLLGILDDIAAIIFDASFSESVIDLGKKHKWDLDLLYFGNEILSDRELNLHCFKTVESIPAFIKSNTSFPKSRFNIIDEKELYYPVISSTLIKMMKTPVEIYLRVRKADYYHYIKFIRKDVELEQEQIEKLEQVSHVFIKREDKEFFFEEMNKVFLALLKNTDKPKSGQTKNEIRIEVFNQLISVGLSEKSTKIASITIDSVTKSLSNGLLKEMKSIYSSDTPANYRKSFITLVLCISIAKKLSWVTPSNVKSLVLVSFFNDRLLIKDSMQFIIPGRSLEISDYTDDEKFMFLNHARLTADWAAKQKSMPPEVVRIIRQHHGSVQGIGSETVLNSQITKLAILFIVAEEFAMEILRNNDEKLNVIKSLEGINARYKNKTVKDVIEALFLVLQS